MRSKLPSNTHISIGERSGYNEELTSLDRTLLSDHGVCVCIAFASSGSSRNVIINVY